MTLRRFSVYFTLAVALVLVGGVAACSDDDGDDGSPDPTTTQPTTTLSQDAQDEEALRQLAEDWYAQINAIYLEGESPSTAEEFITGEYLDQVMDLVEDFRSSGESYEPGDGEREVVESIDLDGDEAVVIICVFDDGVYRTSDGEVRSESNHTFRFATQATRTADGWRFSAQNQVGVAEEGDQCPGS